ncbi:MAG: hypothetical protein HY799_06005 [Nitrosomonadales bacterium]|nr:hypothetical protein [Nitrosomonadales bacterium]
MFENIVSVHTPKVAGTSFLHQLKEVFGEQNVLLDYNDDPVYLHTIVNIDPNCYELDPIKSISPHKVVHGHFQPKKYAHLSNAFRLTFLRHPIDNITSIYIFWMAHDRAFWNSPIFHYCKDRNLTLLQFAALPKLRYLYTRTYFADYDMSQFDFIGDYAHYDSELMRLSKQICVPFKTNIRLNKTIDHMADGGRDDATRLSISDAEYGKLAEILKDDIAFYQTYKGR